MACFSSGESFGSLRTAWTERWCASGRNCIDATLS
jgi:hypothetical protein